MSVHSLSRYSSYRGIRIEDKFINKGMKIKIKNVEKAFSFFSSKAD